ncbi:disulfide bond formation protein B [Undibacterium sp. TJN25]|uniref:disulfide bond formation protein B n=1 Tax=Undibacterium sp. TJN25 TaxID=3413056 RepID=UPI003BF2F7A8
MTIKSKHIHLFIASGSIAALAVNIIYVQDYLGLRPCSLCVLQRLAYMLIAVTALMALSHDPRRKRPALANSLLLAWSAVGIVLAGGQIWLGNRPALADCHLGVAEKFLAILPLAQWWPAMFESHGDCAATQWTLLQLSIADISMAVFVLIAVLSIAGARKKRRESARMMFS